jgi:orotate phosphoribosyltransferase
LFNCQFDVIAGGETAGIPFAAFLASQLNKPMIYVRKAAKGHGARSQIEGVLSRSSRVLLVEDLITDGRSKLAFIHAIRDAGARIEDVLVVFDRLQGGAATLQQHDSRLIALTDLEITMHISAEWKILPPEDLTSVREYLVSPAEWHARRSLPYSGGGE